LCHVPYLQYHYYSFVEFAIQIAGYFAHFLSYVYLGLTRLPIFDVIMQSSLFICLSILFFFLNGCTTLNVFFFFFQIQTFFLFFSLFKFFVCLSSFPISLFLYDFYLWSLISVPQGSFPFLFKKKNN